MKSPFPRLIQYMCVPLLVPKTGKSRARFRGGGQGLLSWRRHCSFAAHRLASPIAEVRDAERRMARAYVMFDNLGLCL